MDRTLFSMMREMTTTHSRDLALIVADYLEDREPLRAAIIRDVVARKDAIAHLPSHERRRQRWRTKKLATYIRWIGFPPMPLELPECVVRGYADGWNFGLVAGLKLPYHLWLRDGPEIVARHPIAWLRFKWQDGIPSDAMEPRAALTWAVQQCLNSLTS